MNIRLLALVAGVGAVAGLLSWYGGKAGSSGLLAVGACAVCLYAVTSLVSLRAGLLVSFVIAYNPVFSYNFLFLQMFTGGMTRMALSMAAGAILLLVSYLTQAPARPASEAVRLVLRYMTAWLCLPLLGVILGFSAGNPVREIVAELAPLVEFVFYFFLASKLIRGWADARVMLISLVLWCGIVSLSEVVLYVMSGGSFALRVETGAGTLASRLTDFMPVVLLPVGIVCSAVIRRGLLRWLAVTASAAMATVAVLSYYRSVWLSGLAGVALMTLLVAGTRRKTRGLERRLAVGGALTVVLTAVVLAGLVGVGLVSADVASLGGMASRFNTERLLGPESSSTLGRLSFVSDIVQQSLSSPLWGLGMGAPFYATRAAAWMPISDASVFHLKLLYELGLAGFVTYLLLFALVARDSIRAFLRAPTPGVALLSAGVIGGLFGTCLILTVFPALLHFPIAACTAILLVCLLSLGKSATRPAATAFRP